MKSKRRDFLKLTGLAGAGILTGQRTPAVGGIRVNGDNQPETHYKQKFNMSGYAAPKLDKVRIGFIGLGQRGPGHETARSKAWKLKVYVIYDRKK